MEQREQREFLNRYVWLALVSFCLVTPLVGCSPSDSPKIVPSEGNKSAPNRPISRPAPPTAEIIVNEGFSGVTKLCADFENNSPAWISYGPKGQFQISYPGKPPRLGLRFELNSTDNTQDRVGFQFNKNEKPRLFKSSESDGKAAEILSNESTNKPVLRCFRRFASDFIWMDSYLVEIGAKLSGDWSCQGPIGSMKISEEGTVASSLGLGEIFIWSKNGQPSIDIFLRGAAGSPEQNQYGSFFESSVSFDDFKQNRWSYQTSSPSGEVQTNVCTRTQ